MRYLFFIVLVFASCATPRLAKTSKGKKATTSAQDTTLVKLDTLTIGADTTAVAVGPIEIDTTFLAQKDTITVIGVGDIMMGTNYPKPDRIPPNNGKNLLDEVREILSNADVTMGNLEGVLLDEGGTPKGCKNPDVCYVFRSPVKYVYNLVEAGFDVMSLANNHAGDFGDEGRRSSMKTLDSAGIAYAGLVSKPFTFLTRDGLIYGFAAFAPNTGCASINDIEQAKSTVRYLDSLADIVIVSFHGGAEGSKYEHVPRKHELFVGEDRGDVYRFAHAVIDAGADIVFGHGPHVTRAVEVYNNRFIAYSLGNFCTYGGFNLNGVNGLAPIIKVYTNREGQFYKAKITPVYQTSMSPVHIDDMGRVIQRIKELVNKDFPENGLTITNEGWINNSTR